MRCFHNQLSRSSRSASFTSASCSCRTTSAGRAPSLSMSTSMDVKALIFSKIDGCTTWPNFHNCQACAGRFLLHSLPTQLSLSSYTLPMSNLKDKAFSDFSVQSELTKGDRTNPNRPQCECATPNVYLICLQFCLSRKLQNRIPSPRSTVSETTNSAIHQYLQVDLVRSLSHQWRSKNSKPLLVSCACRISSFPILQLLCTCRAPTKMAPDPSTSGRFAWLHLLQLPGMKICKPSGENLSVNFVDNLGFGPGNVLFPSTTASQYIAHVFGMCHNLQCPLALGQEPDWLAREWVWYSGSSRGWMSFTAGWMFSPDLATESSRTRVLALATSFSSTNKKGTGTLKGFGRRVQVVDQEEALVPRSDPLHFGKVVPGLWDAQSLLFVLDFNEPGLAAVLLTMRPPGARGPGAGNDGPPCRIRGAGNDDPPWPNEDSPVALGGGIEWNLSVASRKNRRSKFQIWVNKASKRTM